MCASKQKPAAPSLNSGFVRGRGATAGKAPQGWALPRFWVSIRSYKKQRVKKIWGRILGFVWLKFAEAALLNTFE